MTTMLPHIIMAGVIIISILMMKRYLPKQGVPGWFSAAFCSALLSFLYAASHLIQWLVQAELDTPWLQQLAWYAAIPLLSFMMLALAYKIDWPKEAWGRILLGVCGIYWLCLQSQWLNILIPAAIGISIFAVIMPALKHPQGHNKQLPPLFLGAVLLILSLICHFPAIMHELPATPNDVSLLLYLAGLYSTLKIRAIS